ADRVGQLGAAEVDQPRLGVEQVELRRRAGLEQVDDAPRLRAEVRQPGEGIRWGLRPARLVAIQQRGERRQAEARAAPAEETAAGELKRVLVQSAAHGAVTPG